MFDPVPNTPISRLAPVLVKMDIGLVMKSKAISASPFYGDGLLLAASFFSPSEETAGLSFSFFGLRPMMDAAID